MFTSKGNKGYLSIYVDKYSSDGNQRSKRWHVNYEPPEWGMVRTTSYQDRQQAITAARKVAKDLVMDYEAIVAIYIYKPKTKKFVLLSSYDLEHVKGKNKKIHVCGRWVYLNRKTIEDYHKREAHYMQLCSQRQKNMREAERLIKNLDQNLFSMDTSDPEQISHGLTNLHLKLSAALDALSFENEEFYFLESGEEII
tara:strand:+ start:60 stop:650 length:591 start_codon:yes stop_codon:yes gene_type:complete